jgi:MFS family permease
MFMSDKRYVLLVASLASFVTPFMASAINIALPTIGKEFGATTTQLGWVAMAFLLASAVCLVPFGKAADLIGRRNVFVAGTGLFSFASLACVLAGSVNWLIAARALQGVGGAMIFGTGMAILLGSYTGS